MRIFVPPIEGESFPIHLLLGSRENRIKKGSRTQAMGNKTAHKQPMRVFIVEDERLIAENVKLIIEQREWQVVGMAATGEDAVRKARILSPNLLLMDVRIQGSVDGVRAAALIHQSLIQKPWILFLSAHPQEQFPQLNDLPTDSFGYLRKPYTPEDLIAAIESLVSERRGS